MKLPAPNTIKARGSSTSKDALVKNAVVDEKKGTFYVLKRPAMNAAISALSGTGQLLFPGPSSVGPFAITGDDITEYVSWSRVPAKLDVGTSVANGAVLTALSSFTFNAEDVFGSTATGYTGDVTVALYTNPAGATLSGTLTATAVAGVATFSNVKLNRVGGGYRLQATASGLGSAISSYFKVVSTLNFTTLPSVAFPNSSFQVVVTVKDENGSTATGYNGNITVSIDNNAGVPDGVLSGTLTKAASSGIATFSDLSIDQTGNGYTLKAVDSTSNMIDIVSSGFDIANQVQFTATVGTECYWLLDQYTVNIPVASLPEVVYSSYTSAIASASAVASAVSAANPSLTNVSVVSTQDWGWSGGEPGTVGDPRAIYINLSSDQGPMSLALRMAIQGASANLVAGGKITLSVSGVTYTSGSATINSQLIYIEAV